LYLINNRSHLYQLTLDNQTLSNAAAVRQFTDYELVSAGAYIATAMRGNDTIKLNITIVAS
jgi:hypothetical protein